MWMYVSMYSCLYVYMCVRVYVCMYMYACTYIYLFSGISIYYAESLETIGDNLKEIKPTGFTTVPRLLEKVFENYNLLEN